nr:hypothetical protein GCM10025699_20050 [Microbacterium flavescens]
MLAILAAIPLTLWLMIKLLLAPSAIILEHATIGQALARSWRLTKGRFWPAFGVIILISLVFGFVAQIVSIPFSFLSTGLTTVIAPTGDPEPSAIIAMIVALLLTQAVTLLLQSVAVVVQSTATAIIYIDCRMRHEGLDLDLLAYVERRDAGAAALPDPYREHIGRAIAPRVLQPVYAAPAGYPPVYGQPPAAYGAPPAYGQPAGAYGQPPQAPLPTQPPLVPPYARPADAQPAPAQAQPAPADEPPPLRRPRGPLRALRPTAPTESPRGLERRRARRRGDVRRDAPRRRRRPGDSGR